MNRSFLLSLLYLSYAFPLISQNLSLGKLSLRTCYSLDIHLDSVFEKNLLKDPDVQKITESFGLLPYLKECESYSAYLNLEGFMAYTQNNIFHSRSLLLKADSIFTARDNLSNEHFVRNQIFLGLTYMIQSNFQHAVRHFEKAKQISQDLDNHDLYSESLSNLGWAYIEEGNQDKAIDYLNEAKILSLGTSNWENLGYIYQNLAQAHLALDQYTEARVYTEKAERIWQAIKDTAGLYYVAQVKADIFFNEKDWMANIHALEDAIRYGEMQNITHLHGIIFSSLADTYSLLGREKKAMFYYEKALEYNESLPIDLITTYSKKLATLYVKEDNSVKLGRLLEQQAHMINRKHELLALENKKSLKNDLKLEKERLKNEILSIKSASDERKLSSQNTFIFLLLFLSLITGIACLTSYFQLRQKKILYHKIQFQKEELEKINNRLSHTSELISSQNERLKTQNQELQNFAYTVSHDLKAPLLNMESFSKLLLKKWGDHPDSQLVQILGFIQKGSRDMHRLVSDLLEFSQLEQKKLHITNLKLESLIFEVLESLKGILDQKKARIQLGTLPSEISADPIKLKLVFQNLIHNAVKFVPYEVLPHIKIYSREQASHYNFYIQDNGIGVNPDFQDKIFTMFQKLHPSSEFEGSGIGLATCKKIIQLHGGTMGLQSHEGMGSTFVFTLPKEVQES
ncbi:MAG: ATP-binding protein [Bacteroidota bacterium]